MIESNLPVLMIIVPMLGGILTIFTGRGIGPWLWSVIVTGATFALSLRLIAAVSEAGGFISYPMGSWPPPFGIEYRPDYLSTFVLAIVSGLAVVATIYARASVAREIPPERVRFFYALWTLTLTGLLGIAITGDAFNVYVLLEISSLTLYALIALGKDTDRRALPAAFNYLILGSIGATFILLGIGYLYMETGTLNIADMAARLGPRAESTTVHAALAFLMVGFSLKMALFPLHWWQPNAYAYAPSAVSAFVAATATKVGVYMAFRFGFSIFAAPEFTVLKTFNGLVLMTFASLAIVFGAVKAIEQVNFKKLLAYSSVSQMGYIVLGFAIADVESLQGAIIHILSHALTKGGLFMVAGILFWHFRSSNIENLRGAGRRMPLTMAAFVVGGLGLIGIPGTAGFISKWYLLQGAIEDGLWTLAVVILIGSVLAVVYVWRLVEMIYFQPAPENAASEDSAPLKTPWGLLIPTWILIGGSVVLGVWAPFTTELAGQAARQLLGGAP